MSDPTDRTYAQALEALAERAGAAWAIDDDEHPDRKCAQEAHLFAQFTAGTIPPAAHVAMLRRALWAAWADAHIWQQLAELSETLRLGDLPPDAQAPA